MLYFCKNAVQRYCFSSDYTNFPPFISTYIYIIEPLQTNENAVPIPLERRRKSGLSACGRTEKERQTDVVCRSRCVLTVQESCGYSSESSPQTSKPRFSFDNIDEPSTSLVLFSVLSMLAAQNDSASKAVAVTLGISYIFLFIFVFPFLMDKIRYFTITFLPLYIYNPLAGFAAFTPCKV